MSEDELIDRMRESMIKGITEALLKHKVDLRVMLGDPLAYPCQCGEMIHVAPGGDAHYLTSRHTAEKVHEWISKLTPLDFMCG